MPASLVVSLVALPLCLGVALASGAPLFSGLIAGIVGGIVIGALSKSPLSVSGPAAGLTVIVFTAIDTLPSFEAFLLSVMLAGAMQMVLAATRAGVLSEFVPSSVVTGMLAERDKTAIIRAILSLAQALGMQTVAEGIETPELAQTLAALGCTYGQGYHFARPLGADAAYQFLLERNA